MNEEQTMVTPEMQKVLMKQRAIQAAKDFTTRMVTERRDIDELKIITIFGDDNGSLLVAYAISEMKALGNKLEGMYGYVVPTSGGLVRETCTIWSRGESESKPSIIL